MKNRNIVLPIMWLVIFFFCGTHVASPSDKKPLRMTGGKLNVISIPPGAEVFINRYYKGIAPLTIGVPSVSFELRLGGMEGFEDHVDNVFVANGETRVFEVNLQKASTLVQGIENNIQETNKFVDTQKTNIVNDNNISAVDNTVSDIGEIDVEDIANKYEPARTQDQTIKAIPKTIGTVYIETVPSGASIYINGKYKAKSPAEISLSGGNLNVVIIKEKYRLESIALNIKEGINPPIMVRLTPK